MLAELLLIAQLEGPPLERTCISRDMVQSVYAEYHMVVRPIEGNELAGFLRAWRGHFREEVVPDVDLMLMIERGPQAVVYSFRNGCVVGQGLGEAKLMHELLGESPANEPAPTPDQKNP